MYHMNLVRRDFESKFSNTSTTDRGFLSEIETNVQGWQFGENFNFGKKGVFKMHAVENEFGTFDPGV